MKSWISAKAKKGLSSKIHGFGLFAVADILKDEIVDVKAGHLLTYKQVQALPFVGHADHQIADDIFVCPLTSVERDESMIYINHSCNPNTGVRGDVVYVAMDDIPAGTELVMDYAMIDSYD